MGFFDRFSGKKSEPTPAPAVPLEVNGTTPVPVAGVKSRLVAAREKLEALDLPGALAIYEELLTTAGDRADVLVAISGDLGSAGHVAHIIELVAPRYDANRHGPATGLNLLQAYLAVRNADAAQHVLDILFGLNRPELEDRLHGFSNAIAELIASPDQGPASGDGAPVTPTEMPKVSLISISKPIWFYGLEAMAEQLLPPKEGRLRRIAFAQLALPGYPNLVEAMKKPEDELGRLCRAVPLWFAETFYFSPSYTPIAAVGLLNMPDGGGNHYALFGSEWSTENLRQLVETSTGGLDYIVTGALGMLAGDYELSLRVWEVKSYRERKSFKVRWTPATADQALSKLQSEVRAYMEWSPTSAALAYTVPAQPRAWLDTLGASLGLFLVEKQLLTLDRLPPVIELVTPAGEHAATGEAASLAFLTLRHRAGRVGAIPLPPPANLARSPLVTQAERVLNP